MGKCISVVFVVGVLLFSFSFDAACLEDAKATSSSVENSLYPENSIDGDMQTRWGSEFSDDQWLKIDLGKTEYIVGLTLYWEAAYALSYDVLISEDGKDYRRIYSEKNSDGNIDDIYFGRKKARFIKLDFNKRATSWGYSLWEIEIKGLDEEILIEASSSLLEHKVDKILDGNPTTYWHSQDKEEVQISIDLKNRRYLGGLFIQWADNYAKEYEILASEDGRNWQTVYKETDGDGGSDKIPFNLLNKRFLKVKCSKSSGRGYGIKDMKFKRWKDLAKSSKLDTIRGLVGAENFPLKVFTGRDGSYQAQPHPHVVSFWVYDKDKEKLYTPETLPTEWRLEEGGLPISIVSWTEDDIGTRVKIFSKESKGSDQLITFVKTSVDNESNKEKNLSLLLVIKKSPLAKEKIRDITLNKNVLEINGKPVLFLKQEPEELKSGVLRKAVDNFLLKEEDAYVYDFRLEGNKHKDFYFISVSSKNKADISTDVLEKEDFTKNLEEVKNYWRNKVPFKLSLPDERFVDCFYASIYCILICMDNYELHPGPLNYASFFLHDAVEMVSALDKVGLNKVAEKALDYFRYKKGDGYVDELGGSIFSLYEHYLITKDRNYLKRVYPEIKRGCKLIKELRQPQFKNSLKDTTLYGLLPKGVSQDNFKYPAHLYVDNWWAIIGLKSAYEAACVLDKKEDAEWIKKEYESLYDCTLKSIKKAMQRDNLNYMPGFADYWPDKMRKVDADHRILGDTQMAWAHRPALSPGDALGVSIPYELFKKSYEKYWGRAGKFSEYDGGWYVEYERFFWGYNVKLAHPLIYLAMEEVALKNIYWSINNQSCPGGWMEAMPTKVDKEGKRIIAEGIVGDVPHGWVAADYILLLRDMLLREKADKLILLSCIPDSWLDDGKVIEVKDAPTYFGKISFKLESHLSKGYLKLSINTKTPPNNGYILRLDKKINKIKIDGKVKAEFTDDKITIPKQAKEIIIYCQK